jgi:murein DD-endopeptidase MepM/ murein hydrolase activator NlpD
MSTYTVQPGDTLPSIARALLGSPGRWRELQLYNLQLLIQLPLLEAGMVLRLPPGAAVPARSAPSSASREPGTLERTAPVRAVARTGRRRHAWARR